MGMSYEVGIRLDRIEAALARIEGGSSVEAALRAEIEALVAAGKVSADEKAAMEIRINAATMRAQQIEDRMGAVIPSNSPPPA